MRKRLLYAADTRWAVMARDLDQLMRAGDLRPLKEEGRTQAALLAGPDGTPVFVKHTNTGSWMRGLIAALSGSRAKRWLNGARMLETAGFNRPAPLAALEVRGCGAVFECYLACQALSGARILSNAVFGDGTVSLSRRRALLSSVAHEVRRLHDASLYTRDLQETNLMIEERADADPRIWFVDLEDFRRSRGRVSWRRRLTNLVHLDRSLGRFLNRGARMRFFRDYVGAEAPGRAERRRLVIRLLGLRARVESRRRLRRSHRPVASDVPPGSAGVALLSPPASH